MTAQSIHKERIQEHLEVLREAIAIGLEHRPATIGFHTSACAIDFLELYLHKTDQIPIGKQIKHDWFKRPKPGQKITPLAVRQLPISFPQKNEIFELLYSLEETRTRLIYGKTSSSEAKHAYETFEKMKKIVLSLLADAGEHLEDPDQ